jgi:hypothetical protein
LVEQPVAINKPRPLASRQATRIGYFTIPKDYGAANNPLAHGSHIVKISTVREERPPAAIEALPDGVKVPLRYEGA